MAVDETLADRRHLELGDTLRMWAYSPAQVEGFGSLDQFKAEPLGGAFDLTVTGVVRTPDDLAPVPSGQDVVWLGREELYLTPAFWRAHRERVAALGTGVELRLRNGLRDLDAFTAAVRRLPGGRDADVYANSDAERAVLRLERAIRIEVAAQLVFAALAALTGLFVVGQSIARQVQLDAADHPTLRALGMTSGQLIAAVLMRGVLVGVGGALLATMVAVLLSPLTPIGLARRAEVVPGIAVDAPVLVLGAAGLLLAVLARTGMAGWAATRTPGPGRDRQPAAQRRSRIGDALAGAGGPPSAVIGTRLAFESGPGDGRAVGPDRRGRGRGRGRGRRRRAHLRVQPRPSGRRPGVAGLGRGRDRRRPAQPDRRPRPGRAPAGREPVGGRLLVPHHPAPA